MFPNRHSARRARAGPGEGPSARCPTSNNGPVIGSYPVMKTCGRGPAGAGGRPRRRVVVRALEGACSRIYIRPHRTLIVSWSIGS